MIGLAAELGLVLAGLVSGLILFRRVPVIPKADGLADCAAVSIIIPARNEALNLPLLLADLMAQTLAPLEILCVDDDSEDDTAAIARQFPIRLLELKDKPPGWMGKTWACFQGARQASGEWLVFLDADVRLGPDALKQLMAEAIPSGQPLTVQPWHQTQLPHEDLAMIFNLIQIGSTGAAMDPPRNQGMFGPRILIPRADYWSVGGHETVRASIVEDVALGMALEAAGISYRMFIGDPAISFRMYPDGIGSLIRGWTKNMAAGAGRMPLSLFVPAFLWITAMTSVPVHIIRYGLLGRIQLMALYGSLYVVWVGFFLVWAPRAGNFRIWTMLLYPVSLVLFISVFFQSVIRRALGLKVTWKGRAIDQREAP